MGKVFSLSFAAMTSSLSMLPASLRITGFGLSVHRPSVSAHRTAHGPRRSGRRSWETAMFFDFGGSKKESNARPVAGGTVKGGKKVGARLHIRCCPCCLRVLGRAAWASHHRDPTVHSAYSLCCVRKRNSCARRRKTWVKPNRACPAPAGVLRLSLRLVAFPSGSTTPTETPFLRHSL